MNTEAKFHRCVTCKILRTTKNYLTKCCGIIEVENQNETICLTVSNSVLTAFIKYKLDLSNADQQDIEELFLNSNPLEFTCSDSCEIAHIGEINSNTESELSTMNVPETPLLSIFNNAKKHMGQSIRHGTMFWEK